MRKLLILSLGLVLLAGFSFNAQASKYTLDNNAVDQLFEAATPVALNVFDSNKGFANPLGMELNAGGEKDAVVAILLDFFLGGLGIHRFYLGTETLTGIGYILTCGGIFGIVPFVDLIVLIIDHDDISPYIDNPKFFMW